MSSSNSIDKKLLFKTHSPEKSEKDTGSPESQIAVLTHRIRKITDHLKLNKKDKSSQRGLVNLVSLRNRLLKYLKRVSLVRYNTIIQDLSLRK